ncbi:MAG: DUF2589 domain-containing protein [Flavobacteriales bacterium]|nr:DUF2589 domain-containing protein [Flavobacteriales bacterium]
MSTEQQSIANQFKGLPMEVLIGGPLKAACDANVLMAKATANFINDVGFDTEIKEVGGEKEITRHPRMVDFSYEKPGKNEEGKPTIEVVKIEVPILAIVPIPNLQVNNVDITFDMEVKNSTASKVNKEKEAATNSTVKGILGPVGFDVNITGSVSSKSESTRSSDSSAKYHIEINAQNMGTPEGLSRILDMMNQSAAPKMISQYEMDEKGEKTGDAKLIDLNGKVLDAQPK